MTTTQYLIEAHWRGLNYLQERDTATTDFESTVRDLMAGEVDHIVRVLAIDVSEKWCFDVSEDVAREMATRAFRHCQYISDPARSFCERHGIYISAEAA